ncbi:hypothetical protein [Flavobacterium soli]|uniref:hypothetical protein n=1 Tax=Flavobacterium soli TaxID=344881 RepID=UPI00047B194C|nr:hypothetical protein [Flavobacterium soli]
MENFRGQILYDLQLDGSLTGVYTNNHPALSGILLTEIARVRLDSQAYDRSDGIFEYDSVYIDIENSTVNCELTFRVNNRIIQAEWRLENGRIVFRGEGFLMNDRQIALSYWSVNAFE